MRPGADPIVPEPLRPGARVAVVAPSSPFDRDLVLRGLEFLRERYRVEIDPGLFEKEGYLAGSDERRLSELDRYLRDPDVGAIVTARGGYGLLRIAHRADWASLRRFPKWLVGFSDATTLHLEAGRAGVASLHAENVGGLGRGGAPVRDALVNALENPAERRTFGGLTAWNPGRARGTLVGGNLTLIASAATAGRLSLPVGAVLMIEDVTEAAYRIDRLLTGLIVGGHLDGVGAVVVGDFSECPASHGVDVYEVLRERLSTLRVPVAAGLPVGHGGRNMPLVLGVSAELDASESVFSVGS
jgi:muramoyltetrapeptide carboxypeptidase